MMDAGGPERAIGGVGWPIKDRLQIFNGSAGER
jgi:hypothetical protein